MKVHWHELSPTMQALLMGLVVVQLLLWLVCLVWWARTPAGRMTLPKPAWLLVILMVNGIGPLAWIVAGRRPAPVDDHLPATHTDARQAVDTLYGQQR